MSHRRTNRGQKESGRAEARPRPPATDQGLTVKDVIADGRNTLGVPARRNIARVEEERVADGRILEILVDDLRDRDRRLPLLVRVRYARQRMAMNERELAALEQHSTIGRWETTTAGRAVCDHLPDGELTGEGFALRFEIDSGGEALELMVARIGTTKV